MNVTNLNVVTASKLEEFGEQLWAKIQQTSGTPMISVPDSQSSQELQPNTCYVFPSRTSALTLTLGNAATGIVNEYHFFIESGSTAPTVSFPAGISWNGGSAPTIAASKIYEVSILNNIAAYFEI